MYEVPEEPEDSPHFPAGGQTETGGVVLSPTLYLPAAEVCVSFFGRFGYYAFPTPPLAVLNALWEIGPAFFVRANLSNPYSSCLLEYFVHATRGNARSRLAIIAWPAGLSGDNQRISFNGRSSRNHTGSLMIISSRACIWPSLKTARRAGGNDPRRSPPHQQGAAGPPPKTLWLP
ncbi:hypothetical protein RF11_04023 [Thelohanellus kitauei]|uniref:Uncharacterized protein n=1 Tax=Thelohanellus kitauei TaxID=669202 RepID=A0A0C2MYN2_THEKT|nr:hypothetical protein RF11_04023 [Thelohanellus kitauei]